jgi:type II secretory ATPase GspE/PulE/Tfp pilus assembly ATPase PilB-like protein
LNGQVFRHPEASEIKLGVCRNCKNRGYRGRTAVAEVLYVTRAIREMIATLGMPKSGGADIVKGADIVRYAVEKYRMTTLEDSAVEKMRAGQTSRAEIERVISLATTIHEPLLEGRAIAAVASSEISADRSPLQSH